jgi:hypothetical protein
VIHLLVGDQLAMFASLGECAVVAFQMLGGEYPFLELLDTLPKTERYFVYAWFWTYLIIAVFIFLNVFITILGEAYEKAGEHIRVRGAKSKLSYHWTCLTPVCRGAWARVTTNLDTRHSKLVRDIG